MDVSTNSINVEYFGATSASGPNADIRPVHAAIGEPEVQYRFLWLKSDIDVLCQAFDGSSSCQTLFAFARRHWSRSVANDRRRRAGCRAAGASSRTPSAACNRSLTKKRALRLQVRNPHNRDHISVIVRLLFCVLVAGPDIVLLRRKGFSLLLVANLP